MSKNICMFELITVLSNVNLLFVCFFHYIVIIFLMQYRYVEAQASQNISIYLEHLINLSEMTSAT